jgi:hypothetical protein
LWLRRVDVPYFLGDLTTAVFHRRSAVARVRIAPVLPEAIAMPTWPSASM